eukprot:5842881-Lingulodinium_polyedra.AAC.1
MEEAIFLSERAKNDTFVQYTSQKVYRLRNLEAQLGEKLPDRLACLILKRGAALSDSQRQTL